MKKYILLSLVSLLSCVWGLGCAQIPSTYYYTFRPDVEPLEGVVTSSYPYILLVEEFEADAPYNQEEILFRTSPYEVNFYDYHKWLRPPEDVVTEHILQLIDSTHMFRSVKAQVVGTSPDYVLQGRIKMLEQWADESAPFVRIRIEYALIAARDERILWLETVDTQVSIASLAIVETMKGFEIALRKNVLQGLNKIDNVLSQQNN